MTLLLTGATGRTGRYIAETIAARGLRARALVRELDELLCAAADEARRSAGRTHPKGGS